MRTTLLGTCVVSLISCAVWAAACGGSTADDTAAASSAGGAAGGTAGGAAGAAGGSGAAGAGTAGSGTAGSSGGAQAGSAGMGAGTGGGAPAGAGGMSAGGMSGASGAGGAQMCATCLTSMCSSEITACMADAPCDAVLKCIEGQCITNPQPGCVLQCVASGTAGAGGAGGSGLGKGTPFAALRNCSNTMCTGSCPSFGGKGTGGFGGGGGFGGAGGFGGGKGGAGGFGGKGGGFPPGCSPQQCFFGGPCQTEAQACFMSGDPNCPTCLQSGGTNAACATDAPYQAVVTCIKANPGPCANCAP